VQLHQPDILARIAALDAHLLVIAFAELERVRHWIPFFTRTFLRPGYERAGVPPPEHPFARTRFAADPTRGSYHAYGLGRNSVLRVYGPRVVWQYVRWGLQGRPIRIQDDALQRGGNFVVGRDGRLTLAHTGRDQSDRPSVAALLAALAQGE
jgi:hypothetical protein